MKFRGRVEEMFSFHLCLRGGVAGMDWRGSGSPTVEVEATHESNSGLSILCTTFSLALPSTGVRCSRSLSGAFFGVLVGYKVAGASETSRPMLTA